MAQPADENKALESEIFNSKYRKIKTVGKGSFGEAVLVRSKSDGRRYIVKAIESANMTPKEKRDVQNEIKILASVNHPNIVRFHESFEDGTLIFIAMEYADGGDLNSRIKDQKKKEPLQMFDPNLALFWFLQICMALKYLHDRHILHRDIKTANIFLTSKNVVKLGDFGISTVLQNTMACAKTVCGTPYYFSPELCQSKPYNNKGDVWALGVIFYETLTLNRPFNAKSLKELLKKILVGQYDPIPQTVPQEMRNLCASLLQTNPAQRPSVNRILESHFVQQSLKTFSADLEDQAAKDKAEFEAKGPLPTIPQQVTQLQQQSTAPSSPQVNEREQMAMLRGMGRDNLKAMLAQQGPQLAKQPGGAPQANSRDASAMPEIDDDGSYIQQKQAMVQQTKEIVGKLKLGGHEEEFGDAAPANAGAQVETITLANGQSLPAQQVRGALEQEIGAGLLNKAVEYASDVLSTPNPPTTAEIQRELNILLGAKFAQHANAVSKLAIWESKH